MSDLRRHYRELFAEHGDSPRSAQHFDVESQRARFGVLAGFAPDLGSVVDLGCGLGHFYDFLKEHGFEDSYLGLDFVPEFVECARQSHAGDARARFQAFDMRSDAYPEADTFVMCGVFNNKMPDNEEFLRQTLTRAFMACRKGVAFNLLSTYVDYQDARLFYADPLKVFDFCQRTLTRRAVLRHDYLVREDRPPYEYAVYLYK